MTPEQWQNIKRVLAGALEKAPKDRRAYLDHSCPDPDLRREVESLIAAHEQGDSDFMEPPAKAGPLQPGTKLGPYEIVSQIGAGGMGEVYRGHDSKLRRDVAIKVLPSTFASAPDRLARFQREARMLASLNHPNIASIYGLEDSAGTHALAMELVEGPTLADRIGQAPIPVDEALPIAKQIAEGLEYAHEHGIVHRDLKPANIKAAADGTVKILDFGLAKAMETGLSPDDIGDSPTLSQMATQRGVLLGTAAYMSPEQAKAKPVDRRADVWAFGCVLFEMLTGKLAFPGESVTETLAAVLKNEPDWPQLPKDTPPHLRVLLYRCLQKDPKQRLQAIGDARIAIDELVSGVAPQIAQTTPVPPPTWRRVLPWAAAGLMTLVALAVALFPLRHAPAPPAASVTRFDVDIGTRNLAVGYGGRIVISPDGRKTVFVATSPGSITRELYLRLMDSLKITPLPGTQGASQPFFSPDSQWVGFSANDKLMKVPLTGGLPVTLCDIPDNGNGPAIPRATWADNGFIYFLTQGKLERVPGGGGTPQPVAGAADPDKLGYVWISSLPGSRGLLLVAHKGNSEFDIDVLSLETGKSTRLIDGGSWPRYLPTGQILYAQYSSIGGSSGFTGGLLAVPFDLKRLARAGSPIPATEGVLVGTNGVGYYDVAADGTLVYFPSGITGTRRLAWLDSKGKVEPLPAPPGNYRDISISPDGKRVALTRVTSSSQDIYVYDLTRGTMQRLTFEGINEKAVFTPDGSRVIYDSTGANGGVPNLWMRPADGSGNRERLTTSEFPQWPGSVSPDGKLLAYFQVNPSTGYDIYVMPLGGDRKARAFLHTPSDEALPMFSPDGKWIADPSDESGSWEIFVQAFPGPGGKRQISTRSSISSYPVWSRDGKKLYYTSGDNLMEVDVTTRPTFSAGTPRLVAANLGILAVASREFDVAPDGRILVATLTEQSQQESSQLHVILNFSTEVQNRLQAAKH